MWWGGGSNGGLSESPRPPPPKKKKNFFLDFTTKFLPLSGQLLVLPNHQHTLPSPLCYNTVTKLVLLLVTKALRSTPCLPLESPSSLRYVSGLVSVLGDMDSDFIMKYVIRSKPLGSSLTSLYHNGVIFIFFEHSVSGERGSCHLHADPVLVNIYVPACLCWAQGAWSRWPEGRA